MTPRFRDRTHAGKCLAQRLMPYAYRSDVLVLALPRGGVPVGFEVAQALHVPLDVCLVRKLGVPRQRELAMGAIASGGIRVLNPDVVEWLKISEQDLEEVTAQEQQELERREQLYRGKRPLPDISRYTVIVVDDGLATGSTMRAAIAALKQQHARSIVVAVPVSPPSTCAKLHAEVEEVVCLDMPESLGAIGSWYDDFSQTTDDEVRTLLARSLSFSY